MCRLSFSSNVNSESAKEEYRKASRNAAVPEVLDDLLCHSAIFYVPGANSLLYINVKYPRYIPQCTFTEYTHVTYELRVLYNVCHYI